MQRVLKKAKVEGMKTFGHNYKISAENNILEDDGAQV